MKQLFIIATLVIIAAIIILYAKSLIDADRRQDELKQGQQNAQ